MKRKNDLKVRVVLPADALWDECASLEYRVFRDCGYVGESPEGRIADFDRYSPVEMVCVQSSGRVVGTWRNIYAPGENVMRRGLFPTYDNAEALGITPESLERIARLDPRKVADCAAAAILPEYRTGAVSMMLFGGALKNVWEHPRVVYAFGAGDAAWVDRLKRRGLAFHQLGPPTMYWGSNTVGMLMNTTDVLKNMPIAVPLYLGGRAKGYAKWLFHRT